MLGGYLMGTDPTDIDRVQDLLKQAGFLGWQWIDHNCWMNALAEQEANAEVKARLNCESRRFRNGIAYDQPKKDRQTYCVGFMKEVYLAEIAEQREELIRAMEHELELKKAGLPTDPKG